MNKHTKRLVMRNLLVLLNLLVFSYLSGQNGLLLGTVKDRLTQEGLIGATIVLEGTDLGVATDAEGNFRLESIPPRSYNVQVSYLGYAPQTRFNIVITSGNATVLNLELDPDGTELEEVVVKENKSIKIASMETPLSIQNLSAEEIKSNPGGNFDISRVVQALPGVGGTAGTVGGFRNDLIIRGGGPSENVFYLDGVEIPVINHFATQGAAGGPTGILNVSFIEDATLATSAFGAKYDNVLSSVLQFKQRDGNPERFQGNFRLSGTEAAFTGEGPLGKKTTFLASARRSYLQLLFELIDLPIRPNYWDFQYKITHKFDAKTTLTAIGVGAIDEFSFALPQEATPENLYVLSSNPRIDQWNYTQGLTLKKLINKGYWNLTFSRNVFNNQLNQFSDNFDGQQTNESKRTLGVNSQEAENKLRFEINQYKGTWKWSYGGLVQYAQYDIDAFTLIQREKRDENGLLISPAVSSDFVSGLDFWRYGLFGQVNKTVLNDRLAISFGIRADGNSFTTTGNDLWRTLSPRISTSYAINNQWKVNGSIGRYFRLPLYTGLGYRSEVGALVNQDLPYLRTDHIVAGLEFLPTPSMRITAEGFFKSYKNYLIGERSQLSLANQGGNFGIIGNEPLSATGIGESYGVELFFQQKLIKDFFLTGSYTLFWSQFDNGDGVLVPSAWDNRHLLSVILGRKFARNWEIGLKWRFQGGAPFTPFDQEASLANFATFGSGTLDLNQINAERLGNFSQFDFRLDKKWNFRQSTLDVFFDVQNAFVQRNPAYPQFTLRRNANNSDFVTSDGQTLRADGKNGQPIILANDEPSVVPTLGFIFEF